MDRTRYIPSIVSLAGAFVACLVTIINSYDTLEMLFIVLAALIVFYIVGTIIRAIVKRALIVQESEEDSEIKGEDTPEDENSENAENEEEDLSEEDQEEE